MDRRIVHLDLDSFYVSVERRKRSDLNGLPVIIGGFSDRGVVASCSYEARQFGVHSAMPSRLARQLCPQAIWIRGDMDEYSRYSREVTDIIQERAPVVEKASIDEHYLDLTGMDKYFGCVQWTKELRQTIIRETGLPISFGLSVNKTVAKMATNVGKPNGEQHVKWGTEKAFLAPLSVRKIPMLGPRTATVLRSMGIEKIRTLQQTPVDLLERTLGDNGISIWNKANGVDDAPVVPFSERKSMSTETTYDKDTGDRAQLRQVITGMVETLAFDLRRGQRLTSCLTVKIRYSDFDTHTQQVRISHTASDAELTKKALELFQKLYTRRMPIRLIGVKFSNLVSGSYQIDLFNDTLTQINLYQAMDRIRNKFGAGAVRKVAGMQQRDFKKDNGGNRLRYAVA